jgi:CRP/FNR family transcriptional regulator, anaerobic regulatory protein
MKTEKLFSVLSSIHPVSTNFRQAVEKVITPLSLPNYFMLLEATKVAECAYFLDEGFAMSYTFVKGKKQVEWFWRTGEIMVSARSFFEQVPSQEFIQLRNHSELFCVTHNSVLQLFQTFPEAHFIYRVIMNQYYEHSRERTRDMQHLTAVERYEKLIRIYPHVEQHVTQEHIASYLGIAPQSFSRIKRRKI